MRSKDSQDDHKRTEPPYWEGAGYTVANKKPVPSVDNERLLYVDCDDTLVLWDLSSYPEAEFPRIELNCWGPVMLAKHEKNINLVKKFAKLGYGIIVWSQTGAEWAETVARAVGIDDIATLYLTKPRYHLDDLPANAWMGERLYRDAKTGESIPRSNSPGHRNQSSPGVD